MKEGENMANGITLSRFNREMASLVAWKQKLIRACFVIEDNPAKLYKQPVRLLRATG